MQLAEYLAQGPGRLHDVARRAGLAQAFVWQIAVGKRPCPIRRARALSAATDGEVGLHELRPDDWAEVWPELAEAA